MGNYYISNYVDAINLDQNTSLLFNCKIYDILKVKSSLARKITEQKGRYVDFPDHVNISELINAKILLINNREVDYQKAYQTNLKKIKGTLPLSMRFVASYDCNENCEYCLIKDIRHTKTEYFNKDYLLHFDKLMDAVNTLSPVAPFTETNITLIGGEPTLEKNWIINKYFLNYINTNYKGNNHTLVTNGFGLTNGLLTEFKNFLGKEIYLSYDISGECYKDSEPKQRTDLNAFKELCLNVIDIGLNIVIDLKISPITINTLDSDCLNTLKELSQYGNVKILCSPIVTIDEYNPLMSSKCDKFDLLIMQKKGLLNIGSYLRSVFKKKMIWPVIDEKMIYRCNTTNLSSLCFYPDGKVTTCGRLYAVCSNDVPIIADLNKNEIYDDILKNFIYTFMDDEECVNCNDAYICGGKCYFAKNRKCNDEKAGLNILKNICKL